MFHFFKSGFEVLNFNQRLQSKLKSSERVILSLSHKEGVSDQEGPGFNLQAAQGPEPTLRVLASVQALRVVRPHPWVRSWRRGATCRRGWWGGRGARIGASCFLETISISRCLCGQAGWSRGPVGSSRRKHLLYVCES